MENIIRHGRENNGKTCVVIFFSLKSISVDLVDRLMFVGSPFLLAKFQFHVVENQHFGRLNLYILLVTSQVWLVMSHLHLIKITILVLVSPAQITFFLGQVL